ncbi:MAG: NAD(+)/NADH kinase [Firmicutes bacterium]|nr:NAD(+)/NADH kinase [Bacillota bacterium]
MDKKIITVFSNDTQLSTESRVLMVRLLHDKGYEVTREYTDKTSLIVCIGGDGSFLETVHKCDFPDCPIVGINTGHLGFFQEIHPSQIAEFVENYDNGNYSVQELNTVEYTVTTADGTTASNYGLNEVTISGHVSTTIHMRISIDNKTIEKFSGSGITVSTSAGSTAYNYSLGGSIVDPRLKVMQVTPIAPINTTAYRSLTSSIMLPSDLPLGIHPERAKNEICINYDGITAVYKDVTDIRVEIPDRTVKLIRFKDYDFWDKVKDKFL